MDNKITSPAQLAERAMQLYTEEEFEEAASIFDQAAREYEAGGDSLKSAEERNNQSVALLRAGKPEAALLASQGTEQIFAKAGDPVNQAKALGNQAAALEALHKSEQAITLYASASDLLKSNGELDLASLLLKSISSIRIRQGKFLESLMIMRQALSLKTHLSFREKMIKSLSDFAFKLLNRPPIN